MRTAHFSRIVARVYDTLVFVLGFRRNFSAEPLSITRVESDRGHGHRCDGRNCVKINGLVTYLPDYQIYVHVFVLYTVPTNKILSRTRSNSGTSSKQWIVLMLIAWQTRKVHCRHQHNLLQTHKTTSLLSTLSTPRALKRSVANYG